LVRAGTGGAKDTGAIEVVRTGATGSAWGVADLTAVDVGFTGAQLAVSTSVRRLFRYGLVTKARHRAAARDANENKKRTQPFHVTHQIIRPVSERARGFGYFSCVAHTQRACV
jgi:hypothetical protein